VIFPTFLTKTERNVRDIRFVYYVRRRATVGLTDTMMSAMFAVALANCRRTHCSWLVPAPESKLNPHYCGSSGEGMLDQRCR